MFKKIVIYAVIALMLVPATVMAAGNGGPGTGITAGQGPCLQNGQDCTGQNCVQGSCGQTQYRYGGQQGGQNGGSSFDSGQCTGDQKQTRAMLRLQDGSCGGCPGCAAAQQ